ARQKEGKQVHGNSRFRRPLALQLQQHLAPQLVRLVLVELLEIQNVLAEPRNPHGSHDSAHAMLDTFGPADEPALAVDDGLLRRVVEARPQPVERLAIDARSCGYGCKACKQQHATLESGRYAFLMRTSPSCAVLATRRPSRAKTLARAKPRAPEALGLSTA